MASATSDNDESTSVSFGCDYAKSSNAKCHGKSCLDEINKGTLRLSRLIPNPFIPQSSTREEQLMPVYYHVNCFINYLRSGNENKKRVENVEKDLEGFAELKKKDQEKLKKLFNYEEQLQGNLSETSTSANTNYLEHDQEKKYWQISIDNKSTKTKYGLLNEPDSNAIILYKDFSVQAEAKKYVEKKTQEKLKHGYTIKKQTGSGTNNQTTRKRKQPTTSAKPTPAKRTKKIRSAQENNQQDQLQKRQNKIYSCYHRSLYVILMIINNDFYLCIVLCFDDSEIILLDFFFRIFCCLCRLLY